MAIFGDGYAVARFGCIVLGSLSTLVVYALARTFLSQALALFSATLVVFNPVHLGNSTVILTPVIAGGFAWLSLFALLQPRRANFAPGVLAGWAHLCTSSLPPALFAWTLRVWLRPKDLADPPRSVLRSISLFLLGALGVLLPWAVVTYRYFGSVLYSNLNFYPFCDTWTNMTFETSPPTLRHFVAAHGGFAATLDLYLIQFYRAAIQAYEAALPIGLPHTVAVAIANVGLMVLGVVGLIRKGKGRAWAFVGYFLSLLAMLSAGSTALGGSLYLRHVLVFIPFLIILWVVGLEVVLGAVKYASRRYWSTVQIRLNGSNATRALCVLGFAVVSCCLAGKLQQPDPGDGELREFRRFWSKKSPELMQAAQWIRKNTAEDSVFMYGFTPQDFWGATHRRVVTDPLYLGGPPDRAFQEVRYYKVDYLVIDSSGSVYFRFPHPDDLSKEYPGLHLSLVWENAMRSFRIYEIKGSNGTATKRLGPLPKA